MTEPLLEVRDLKIGFPIYGGLIRRPVGEVRAVDGVSFTINKGETLGLVGESGCGKSTISKAIANILAPAAPDVRQSGQILFHTPSGPVDLLSLDQGRMRPLRAQVQIVFQDPVSSLNPRRTVGQILDTPLRLHSPLKPKQRPARIAELLERVGLQPEYAGRYPHEFSGGQRQRIGIARALAVEPELIILDEPVSALDVSVQAQVVNLLQDLQQEFGLTYLFVAHDLSVVYHISDRIAVMYLGNIVEIGSADAVYLHPAHPYTKTLIAAVPQPDPHRERPPHTAVQGEIPTPLNKPSGCSFRTRCPIARPECSISAPPMVLQSSGQSAACPFAASGTDEARSSEPDPVAPDSPGQKE